MIAHARTPTPLPISTSVAWSVAPATPHAHPSATVRVIRGTMSHHDVFHDDGPPISQLQAAVKSLDAYVNAVVLTPSISVPEQSTASPPATGSGSSTDHRRPSLSPVQHFSRQEIVAGQWKELARSHVAVCGLSGMGTLAADALVRAGVGRVLLVDNERIHWSSMGQMGFHPDEVGFSRVQALRLRLQSIRSTGGASAAADVGVDSFSVDWSSDADLVELRKKLKVSSVSPSVTKMRLPAEDAVAEEGEDAAVDSDPHTANADFGLGLFEALTQRRPYDAVVSCLEDEADRLALNEICLELSLPLLHASLSPCNSKIFIRTVMPGHSCCLECIERLPGAGEASSSSSSQPNAVDDVAKSIAKAFPASLPHVELMAGGLLAQHTMKFLLEIGDFVPFFTVNALTFEIESYAFPPNRFCSNTSCRQRQEEEQSDPTVKH